MTVSGLASFLVAAKRRTYAAQRGDTAVAPLLDGSKQLEYRRDPFHYRDIYFGMASFAGLETVSQDGRVIWSMSYAGGVEPQIEDPADTRLIYAFLRMALLHVPRKAPFRGLAEVQYEDLVYRNEPVGGLAGFRGSERIERSGAVVYRLDYAGGLMR